MNVIVNGKKFKQMSIRNRLFLLYSINFITILLILSIIIYFFLRSNIRNRIKAELDTSTEMIIRNIETAADVSVKNYLRAVSDKNLAIARYYYKKFQNGEISEAEAKRLTGELFLSQVIGETGYIYACDSHGRPTVHPEKSFIGVDFSHRNFVSKMISQKNGYYEYYWKNKKDKTLRSKAQYVRYFAPWDWIIAATSYRSEFADLINIDDFRDQILSLTLGKHGYLLVINTKGEFLVHPKVTGNFHAFAGEKFNKYLDRILKEKKGMFFYYWKNPDDVKARKKLILFDYIKQYGWIVASTVYYDDVFSPLVNLNKIMGCFILLSLVIIIFVTFKISSTITIPVIELTNRIKMESNLGNTIGERFKNNESRDEISILSDYFNRFMKRLEKEAQIRKKTESDLLELRNYLRDVLNFMPSIIVGVDANCLVTMCNSQAEKNSGILSDAAVGMAFGDFMPVFVREEKKIRIAVSSGEIQKEERLSYIINGAKSYCDITVYPLSDGKKGAVIRIDDVTTRVKLDEMMMQSEKMLSVGGLAAGMAHEINNPLAGILQNLQVMRNRISASVPKNIEIAENLGIDLAKLRKYMEIRDFFYMIESVIASGRRISKIVDNMLNFSRSGEPDFVIADIKEIMKETLELVSNDFSIGQSYDFKNIKLIKNYDKSAIMVSCEPTNLQQVFFNIIKNNAEAMHDAGISDPEIEISIKIQDGMAVIEIENNGPGIPKDIRLRIFEPFFTTKKVGRGTGLGLSIAYFIIVERHNGELSVASGSDYGVKFTITLPMDSIYDE